VLLVLDVIEGKVDIAVDIATLSLMLEALGQVPGQNLQGEVVRSGISSSGVST
jgi:hypothetical protein